MSYDNGISILIPTFNDPCLELVHALEIQCSKIPGLAYEIMVGDDGSTDTTTISINREINNLPNCKYLERKENWGRAAIRNDLARNAHHELLLYIDSHMSIISDNYITRYLVEKDHPLVYGGYAISPSLHLHENLRYCYEKENIAKQKSGIRSQSPYSNFHTSNFMIHRTIMITFPLDERFKRYGYEDVLFGKTLQTHGIPILHIDNPVGFNRFESNERYVEKTEEGLQTLHEFQTELSGYSRLLRLSGYLRKWHLTWLSRFIFLLAGRAIRKNLTSTSPSLFLFKVYRLCYFATLSSK